MSNPEQVPELDADALAMIACYRRAETIPDGLEDRVWEQLEATPEEAGAPPELDQEDDARGGLRWGVVLLVAAAAVGVLAVGLRAVAPEESTRERDGAQAPYRGNVEAASGAAEHIEKEETRPSKRSAGSGVVEDKDGSDEVEPEVEEQSASDRAGADARDDSAQTSTSKEGRVRAREHEDCRNVGGRDPPSAGSTRCDELGCPWPRTLGAS